MGKASKKMKRHVQKRADELQLKTCQGKEQELAAAFEREEYAQVLDLLAELITAKDIKPDLMYKGAYSYFMLGDYERAAQWVTNTLNYAPNDVDTRILLARICFIQNRHDDGLAIYDFLVEHYRSTMSQEQKGQIIDSSEYYVRRESEKLRQEFPHLADFLSVGVVKPAVPEPKPDVQPQTAAGGNALSALQRLKAKLQAIQEKDEDKAETAAAPPAATIAAAEPAVPAEQPVTAEQPPIADQEKAAGQIAEIEGRVCSLREKIQLLNEFAAGHYMADNYEVAAQFLTAALKIDDQDSQTLKNMALTQAAMGNSDKAQALAAKMKVADFVLLQMIKDWANG